MTETVYSAPLRAMIGNIDVEKAVQLDGALERSLASFERDHEALVRQACDVPDSHLDLRDVVQCTFLGHLLSRLEQSKGRLQTERLVATLLEQFEVARQQVRAVPGADPEASPEGEASLEGEASPQGAEA